MKLSFCIVVLCPALAHAQANTCAPDIESSPCTALPNDKDNLYDFCCLPGLVIDNDTVVDGSGETTTWTSSSLAISQSYSRNTGYTGDQSYLTEASYVGLGNIGQYVVSDQYNTGGSTLPLQLSKIASLTGAWTVQVPPVQDTDSYRVYIEMFLSPTTAGNRNNGNITIDFYSPSFGYNDGKSSIYSLDLLGCNNLKVVDYGPNPCDCGQGPFLDFVFPKGTYVPDGSGVLTIPAVDINAVLQWALSYNQNYYSSSDYLSEVNLAQEVSTVDGTFKTTLASFALKAVGDATVYTPTWTDSYWGTASVPSGSKTCGDGSNWHAGVDEPGVAIPYAGSSGGSSGGSAGGSSASSSGGSSGGTVGAGSSGTSVGNSSNGSTGSAAVSPDPSASPIAQPPKVPENVGACGSTGRADAFATFYLVGLVLALRTSRRQQ